MNLLLVGLPEREAALLDIHASMRWPGAAGNIRHIGSTAQDREALTRERGRGRRIVDLAGAGLAAWTPENEVRLDSLLDGSASVVLLPNVIASGWLPVIRRHQADGTRFVQKPISTEQLKDAIEQTFGVQPLAPWRLDTDRAAPRVAPPARARHVNASLLANAFPTLMRNPFLHHLVQTAATGEPHELRLNIGESIVMDPAAGWVASNLRPDTLARLARQDLPPGAVLIRPLGRAAAHERQVQVSPARELPSYLWQQVRAMCGERAVPVQGDVRLRLSQIPDFTRMPATPDVHLELATHCISAPMLLSEASRMFPPDEQPLVSQFFACAFISGAACDWSVLNTAQTIPPPVHRPASGRTRFGFIKALLHKLR